jgi:hypothetical protein
MTEPNWSKRLFWLITSIVTAFVLLIVYAQVGSHFVRSHSPSPQQAQPVPFGEVRMLRISGLSPDRLLRPCTPEDPCVQRVPANER